MQQRRLGKSDLLISPIGFGAWAAGGGGWAFALGPQDDADSIAAIRRAVDAGINWIDTAPLYGLGHSEEIVAQAIEDLPDRPYVFTKCGMPWDASGRIIHSLRRDSIRRECEDSLKRLRVETIDLYQIHWNKPAEEVEGALEAVAELRDEGKIRYAGVSNFTVPELELAREILTPVSLQPPYSAIEREAEADVIPFCGEHDIGVIVYSPMKSGLLSGRMTRERVDAMPPDDLRRQKQEFQEPQLTQNLKLAELFAEIGRQHAASAAEVAVAWTLANRHVTGAIVGLRTPQNVDDILGASSLQLSRAELDLIDQHSNPAAAAGPTAAGR
jgi:aryl-alcohol dehydrogenase-like predicted oxidoreductase